MNNLWIFLCGLIIVSIAMVPIILSATGVEDPWEKEQKLKEKMLEKIKEILKEAAEGEINLQSETARAILARKIVLELTGDNNG